jgi:hypothetical protein
MEGSGSGPVCVLPLNFLEGTRKIRKTSIIISDLAGQDLNPGPTEYEAIMLTFQPSKKYILGHNKIISRSILLKS